MRYVPAAPTTVGEREQNRAIWREFQKIAVVANEPSANLVASETAEVPIGAAPNWTPLSPAEIYDVPPDQYDPVSGVFTCRSPGLYHLHAVVNVEPFGVGNKLYYAGVRLVVTNPGVGAEVIERTMSGDDNFPLTVEASVVWPLLQTATVLALGTLVHENHPGTVTAAAALNYAKN